MFGLENKSKKKKRGEFDLEIDLRDPVKCEELTKNVLDSIQTIKTALRSGADDKDFHDLGVMLHGYVALRKVMEKAKRKKKKR